MNALVLLALLCGPAPASGPAAPAEVGSPELPGALSGVSLSVQVRAWRDLGAAEALLAAVAAAGGRATLIVPAELAERRGETLRALAADGHELALWLDAPADAGRGRAGLDAWKRAAREQSKALRRATGQRPKTALVAELPRTGELALDGLRFRTVLLERPDRPRRILDLSGIPGSLVFPVGAPIDLDEATLDAAAEALSRAAEGSFPTAGLSLDAEALDAGDAEQLQRWLLGVVTPAGVKILPAKAIPMRATAAPGEPPAETAALARPLDAGDIRRAAEELAGVRRLPRGLEVGLTPTEAYLAFCLFLAEDPPPERVLLGPLSPPSEEIRSTLVGGERAEAAAVRDAAAAIAPYLSRQVPSLVDVGDYTLSAAEFLLAMAGVIRGEDPVVLSTPMNPDPYAEGLGWGDSTGR